MNKRDAIIRKVDLIPCPFCGEKAKINTKHPVLPTGKKDTFYQVQCSKRECGIMTKWWYPKQAAVATWNNRAYSRWNSL